VTSPPRAWRPRLYRPVVVGLLVGLGAVGPWEAIRWLQQAHQAFVKARQIGRSDEKVLIATLSCELERMTRETERSHLDPRTVQEAEALVADARAIAPGPDVDLAELAFLARVLEGLPVENAAEAQTRCNRALLLGRQLRDCGSQAIRARKLLSEILLDRSRGALEAGEDPSPYLDEGEALQRGLVASVAWTQADLLTFEQLRLVWDLLGGRDPLPRMRQAELFGLQGLIDYKGDYGAPESLGWAWYLCARADLEGGRLPGEALAKARSYTLDAQHLCADAPGPQLQLALVQLLEAQAALLQGSSPSGLAAPEALLRELGKGGYRPTNDTAALAKVHLLRASACLGKGLGAGEDLRQARACLDRFPRPRQLDACLPAKMRLLEAAGRVLEGQNAIPLLEEAERLVRQRRAGCVQHALLDALEARLAATLAWLEPRPPRLANARKALAAARPTLADASFGARLLAEAGQGGRPDRDRVLKALASW